MNARTMHPIQLGPASLHALAEGALWWPLEATLIVSDLHLGKSERMARRGGMLAPPYEVSETLERLCGLIERFDPKTVISLGDSFDDTAAANALPDEHVVDLAAMMAGRQWVWVLGNHDPAPVGLGGQAAQSFLRGGICFRHIANIEEQGLEISGHFHPKVRVGGRRRPAFLTDGAKLMLPAFGTYTGGLDADDPAVMSLLGSNARAILTGRTMVEVPIAACRKPEHGAPVRWARGLG